MLPTAFCADTLPGFLDGFNQVSVHSIHHHFIEARLRLHRMSNDFSHWLEEEAGSDGGSGRDRAHRHLHQHHGGRAAADCAHRLPGDELGREKNEFDERRTVSCKSAIDSQAPAKGPRCASNQTLLRLIGLKQSEAIAASDRRLPASVLTPPVPPPPPHLDDYSTIVGPGQLDTLRFLAKELKGKTIKMVNSTAVGGGVAEMLNRLVPLLSELGSSDALGSDHGRK